MSRISDLIVKIRYTLADQGERWSDERIVQLLDDAQKDIATHSKLLKGQYDFFIQADQFEYELPEDLWLINRAAYKDCKIDLVSYDSMDEYGKKQVLSSRNRDHSNFRGSRNFDYDRLDACWQMDTGPTVSALVFDNRNLGVIRTYPIPSTGVEGEQYTFENSNGEPVDFVGDELMGVVVGIDNYTLDSLYGVTGALYEPGVDETGSDVFGIVTDVAELEAKVSIWYVRKPATLADQNSELEIPSLFDAALRYYVIAHAFYDDNDAAFMLKGDKFIALYSRELDSIMQTESTDGVDNANVFETSYRGPFE